MARAFSTYYEEQILRLIRKMRLPKGDRVLDAGCGSHARFQSAIESLGYSYVGIDREPPEGNNNTLRFDFNQGFPTIDFDHLICINSLQTFEKGEDFMERVAKGVKRGGKVFLTLPNRKSFHYRLWKWMDRYVYHDHSFINPLTEQSVAAFFEKQGFRLLERGGVMAFPNQVGLISPSFLQPLWVRVDDWLDWLFKRKANRYSYTYLILTRE